MIKTILLILLAVGDWHYWNYYEVLKGFIGLTHFDFLDAITSKRYYSKE